MLFSGNYSFYIHGTFINTAASGVLNEKEKQNTVSCPLMPFPCLLSKPKHGLWAAHWRKKIFLFWCILKLILGAKISLAHWHKFCGSKRPKRHHVVSPHIAVYKGTHHNIPRVHFLLLDGRWMFLQSTNFQIANYRGWRQISFGVC